MTSCPGYRTAGSPASTPPALRLTPAERATTVARVDIWADPSTGLPLRVELYAAGDRAPGARARRSRDSAWTTPPRRPRCSARPPGVDIAYEESVDVAAAANALRRTTCRPRWPGWPPGTARTRARSASTGAARPPLMVLPLRGQVARPAPSPAPGQRRRRRRPTVGTAGPGRAGRPAAHPAHAYRQGALLLTGTVTAETLQQAADRAAGRGHDRHAVIRTRALTKRYGELRAVDAIDLEVARGRRLRVPRRQRLGQDHDGPDAARSGAAHLRRGRGAGPADARRRGVRCCRRIGALVEGPGAYPHLSGAVQPGAARRHRDGPDCAAVPAPGPDRRGAWPRSGSTRPTGGRPGRTRWACGSGWAWPPRCSAGRGC